LYARYAISEVKALQHTESVPRIQPKLFATVATPHLGVSEHTYLPIPRWAENLVSLTMQPTGRDLFRFTPIIDDMAQETKFIRPLQAFEERIAYANAYHTDFQVPTSTAAFIAQTDSLHYPIELETLTTETIPTSFSRFMVQTRPVMNDQSTAPEAVSSTTTNNNESPIQIMSRNLDNLGWTKVFCDVRSSLWTIPVSLQKKELQKHAQEAYTSSDLVNLYARIQDRWALPFGHTVLIANAKSPYYSWLNRGGRPIVDAMARDFVDLILKEKMGE
jgi:Putative serine esterase (DUF676)